mmetsp:Transcript_4384/g.16522  ORF Transcript_4384/g.16522 Transcript_4384/m.16522 type:complete len:215 (+) Transcript_4384:623-1267(+)
MLWQCDTQRRHFSSVATPPKPMSELHAACSEGDLPGLLKALHSTSRKSQLNSRDTDDCTPLMRAALSGHMPCLRELLKYEECDVDDAGSKGQTALILACARGNTLIVHELLSQGANPNRVASNGRSPLHFACWNKRGECVEELLRNGADVNSVDKWGGTPMHLACDLGFMCGVKHMLRFGATINVEREFRMHPLNRVDHCPGMRELFRKWDLDG